MDKSYKLEYGNDSLHIQKQALNKFDSFAIVDDVLATGGTANCLNQILEEANKDIKGLVVVAEIEELCARNKLSILFHLK